MAYNYRIQALGLHSALAVLKSRCYSVSGLSTSELSWSGLEIFVHLIRRSEHRFERQQLFFEVCHEAITCISSQKDADQSISEQETAVGRAYDECVVGVSKWLVHVGGCVWQVHRHQMVVGMELVNVKICWEAAQLVGIVHTEYLVDLLFDIPGPLLVHISTCDNIGFEFYFATCFKVSILPMPDINVSKVPMLFHG